MPAPPPLDVRAVDELRPQVLVVGGGPTGLTAANLLGAMGVRVLLVERNSSTSDDAKAISLDDESLRTMQLAGLDEAIYPIIVPGTGTKYYGARGQLLVHARGTGGYRFGHPFKSAFAQPQFERVLREGLARYPHVVAQFGTELVGLTRTEDAVRVSLRTVGVGGADRQVDVGYVLACDGGRSTVRERLSIPMSGTSFDDVWLVADTVGDPHDQRYGMHHGDPDRPTVIVPGRDGRCRYEFRLKAGEGVPGERPPFALVQELLRPHRQLTPDQVERSVNYRFHALLADRLRDGRCFLLGDAAHMMPPFAGQGLNSGIRDAVNLCWKVADVLGGRADERLLDTYDVERRPHARAMIDLSVRLGNVVMTASRRRALLRDQLIGLAMRTGRGRRYLGEMRYRPRTQLRSGLVAPLDQGASQVFVGQPLPQPMVLSGRDHRRVRLDDVLGPGWCLLGVDVGEADWALVDGAGPRGARRIDVLLDDRSARDRDDRLAIADADGQLQGLTAGMRGRFILLRPDRVVAAVFSGGQVDRIAPVLAAAGIPPAVAASPTVDLGDVDREGAPPHRDQQVAVNKLHAEALTRPVIGRTTR